MARKPAPANAPKKPSPVPRTVRNTRQFKSDLKTARRHRKCDLDELRNVMDDLAAGKTLDPKYLDHALTGRYPDQRGGHTDCRECHVGNDWLLVYRFPDESSIDFIRTGTHSDIF